MVKYRDGASQVVNGGQTEWSVRWAWILVFIVHLSYLEFHGQQAQNTSYKAKNLFLSYEAKKSSKKLKWRKEWFSGKGSYIETFAYTSQTKVDPYISNYIKATKRYLKACRDGDVSQVQRLLKDDPKIVKTRKF